MAEIVQNAAPKAPQGAASVAKTEKAGGTYVVPAGAKALDLIGLDRQGKELLFDGRSEFVVLTDDEVKELGASNRQRYSMAKQQHGIWRASEAERVSQQFASEQYQGRPWDKLNNFEGMDPTMYYRWTRPDKVGERLQQGYVVVGPDELRSHLGPTEGHHAVSSKGQTELVLMRTPRALWEKRQQMRAYKNTQAVQQVAFDQEAARAGVKQVPNAETDKGRDWRDVPTA